MTSAYFSYLAPRYPCFIYDEQSFAYAMEGAIEMREDTDKVIYDDGWCFIVTPYNDCAEGVRITNDELTESQVQVALDWLSDADYDWDKPVDRTTLLDASARAEKEAADAEWPGDEVNNG